MTAEFDSMCVRVFGLYDHDSERALTPRQFYFAYVALVGQAPVLREMQRVFLLSSEEELQKYLSPSQSGDATPVLPSNAEGDEREDKAREADNNVPRVDKDRFIATIGIKAALYGGGTAGSSDRWRDAFEYVDREGKGYFTRDELEAAVESLYPRAAATTHDNDMVCDPSSQQQPINNSKSKSKNMMLSANVLRSLMQHLDPHRTNRVDYATFLKLVSGTVLTN